MSALDALDERQREAASVLRGPVAVLAGAGTGKTRVITHRIAHGVDTGAYTPSRVLAVTFTAKAAGPTGTTDHVRWARSPDPVVDRIVEWFDQFQANASTGGQAQTRFRSP